jgi:hypothetical protein
MNWNQGIVWMEYAHKGVGSLSVCRCSHAFDQLKSNETHTPWNICPNFGCYVTNTIVLRIYARFWLLWGDRAWKCRLLADQTCEPMTYQDSAGIAG